MRARTLALLLLLPLVTACGGGGGTTASPQPRTTRTVVTTLPPLPVPTIVGTPVTFSTAGGNVSCDLEQAFVECQLRAHTWPAPKKPGDCHNAWGTRVQVASGSKGEFICWFGDSLLGAKRVLPTGQALTVGLVTCRAVSGGVQCTTDGNGFLLTDAKYRLF
ncbi:MAG TPA: hypothetical protein VM097_11455 [Mycobacteriales bacterium]|nr:hypothetical protein [Mycobacteriales bacterium]